jgi:hypothetical protein
MDDRLRETRVEKKEREDVSASHSMGFSRPSRRHDGRRKEGRSSSSLRHGDGVWVMGASTFDSTRRRYARKKVGKSSTASLARGRRRSKRLRSDAAPGRGGGARRRAVARRVQRGVAAVRRSGTSALSPRTRSRAPSHAPSADRADRAAPPDAWKAQMRIILKRYRLDGPRPAAIASRAKPWIPSSRVYTRGRTWSRPRARGARCGARGGKPRRA